jgi:hypothetical protein
MVFLSQKVEDQETAAFDMDPGASRSQAQPVSLGGLAVPHWHPHRGAVLLHWRSSPALPGQTKLFRIHPFSQSRSVQFGRQVRAVVCRICCWFKGARERPPAPDHHERTILRTTPPSGKTNVKILLLGFIKNTPGVISLYSPSISSDIMPRVTEGVWVSPQFGAFCVSGPRILMIS